MNNTYLKSLSISALFFLSLQSISATAQLSTEETESVQAELAAALQNYHHGFSTLTGEEMASQIYGAPLVSIGGTGETVVWNSTEEIAEWAENLVNNLRQGGWYRSSMPSPNICVLSRNSGFASGHFIRYREDGSVISRTGTAYIFQRKPEGWRVTTFLSHDNNVQLQC